MRPEEPHHPAPEDAVGALQADLRRTARAARRLSLALRLGLAGLVLFGVYVVVPGNIRARFAGADCGTPMMYALWEWQTKGVPPVLAIGLPASLGTALLATGLYCRAQRRRLRSLLLALPQQAREEALLPVYDRRCAYTRRIAGPLLRDVRATKELIPASAPAARGDEPAPANG